MANLNRNKYDVVPIDIDKPSSWLIGVEPARLQAAEQRLDASDLEATTAVTLTGDPNLRRLIPVEGSEQLSDNGAIDVIFRDARPLWRRWRAPGVARHGERALRGLRRAWLGSGHGQREDEADLPVRRPAHC